MKLSAERNETKMKQFRNSFKTVFEAVLFRGADSLISDAPFILAVKNFVY